MHTHTYPFENGNRSPLPSCLPPNNPHFLYLTTTPPTIATSDIELVANTAKHHLEHHGLGLNPSQIELFHPDNLARSNPAAIAAIQRIIQAFNLPPSYSRDPSILLCEWAAPHTDPSFSGLAFVSLVLHTGPNPYFLQTLYPTFSGTSPVPDVKATTRVLSVGDTFVFDPTTPHFTTPLHPHEDQLLILLQLEIPDETPEDRKTLLEHLPPKTADYDHAEALNGYLP